MRYQSVSIDGRDYRFSAERYVSGRPASIQFLTGRSVWRDVRNIDRSDAIWNIADSRVPA
jgi:hypothetical protein